MRAAPPTGVVSADSRPATVAKQVVLKSWISIALLLVVALGLRVYRLGHGSFWIDEVSSVDVAQQSFRDIILNYRPGHHPNHGAEQAPLAMLVMHFFLSPAAPETSARLPSAILGTATILVLFLFARRIVPTAVAALAAAFLTLSPLHVWYSQEARWYALWIILTILSYWALFDVSEHGRGRAWIAYWLCTVLSIYTFILSLPIVACQGISVLLLDRTRGDRPRLLPKFLAAQGIAVLACAPVFWMIINTIGLSTGTPRPVVMGDLPYTFFAYAAGYSAGPTSEELHRLPSMLTVATQHPIIVVFAAVVAPLLLVGVRNVLKEGRIAALLLPWCFGPALLAFALALVSNVTYQARYSCAALPAFILLLALACSSLKAGWRWVAVTAVCGCFVVSLGNYYWSPEYGKEDARGVVAYIEAAAQSHAPVVTIGQIDEAVAYYGPDLHIMPVKTCQPAAQRHNALQAVVDAGVGLWLAVGRDWGDAGPRCIAWLSRRYSKAKYRHFAGIDLYLFTPAGSGPISAMSAGHGSSDGEQPS